MFGNSLKMAALMSMAMICFSSCYVKINHQNFLSEEGNSGDYARVDTVINVDNFTTLRIDGAPTVTYDRTDGENRVEIEFPKAFRKNLNVEVEDGELSLSAYHKNRFVIISNNFDNSIIMHVYGNQPLEAVYLAGASDFTGMDIESPNFTVQVNGSGDFYSQNLTSGNFSASILGSGDVVVDNLRSTEDIKLSIAGSGDMKLNNLACQNIIGTVSGSGEITLSGKATTADLNIAGSGEIDVTNLKTDNLTTNISGSGDIYTK